MRKKVPDVKGSEILPLFLLSLILIIFFIVPIFGKYYWTQFIVAVLLGLNAVIGVISINATRITRFTTYFFGAIIIMIEFFHTQFANSFWMFFSAISWIIYFCFLELIFLKKVFQNSKNNIHQIMGGIACYLLVGLIFTFIHKLIFHFDHHAYTIGANITKNDLISYRFIYYSFTTLCTVGYGDITPNVPLSQSFSILEGLIGMLFPTILIGSLIVNSDPKKSE